MFELIKKMLRQANLLYLANVLKADRIIDLRFIKNGQYECE